MKLIALAILSVGLCFYIAYDKNVNGTTDFVAGFISFVSATMVLFG